MRTPVGRMRMIPFLLTKILELTLSHDISPAKLCSTARVWNPQGISKLVNKVDCGLWGSLGFAQSDSVGLPCYEILCSGILNVPLPYGMRLIVSPEGRHIFEQLLGFHVHIVVH